MSFNGTEISISIFSYGYNHTINRAHQQSLVSVECFQWDSYIEDVDCLKKSLTNNLWATDEELSSKNEAEVKNLLIEKLNFYYDGEIHSIVDLSMRDVTGDKGSLCGMASLYQAAQQTVLTTSQIKQMSYDDVKAKLGESLGLDSVNVKKENDVDLIESFYSCKYF